MKGRRHGCWLWSLWTPGPAPSFVQPSVARIHSASVGARK